MNYHFGIESLTAIVIAFFHYFGKPIVVLIALVLAYFTGKHFYNKYKLTEEQKSLLEKYKQVSLIDRVINWINRL